MVLVRGAIAAAVVLRMWEVAEDWVSKRILLFKTKAVPTGIVGALEDSMRRRHLFAGRAVRVGTRRVREVRRSEIACILVRHLRTVALEADIRVVDRMLDYY